MIRAAAPLALAWVLVACASGADLASVQATPLECVALFQRFDALEGRLGTPSAREDRRVADPRLMHLGQRLQTVGCFTTPTELADLDALVQPPPAEPGSRILPSSLHAGVVISMGDDARVRTFFARMGVRVRTVGSAPLGRRVYLGPFDSAGAVEDALGLALGAGFASPYLAEF